MGYTVFDTFDLLQFNYGVTGAEISKQADIPYQWITTSKETNKLSNNLQKAIGKVYGDDWNSLEKLRLYQKRLNKVGLVDGKRIKKLRAQREITRKQAAIDLKTSDDRISRIERNEVVLSSWVEYLRFKDYYQDDLLLRDETTGVKKRKRAKEAITFRNIATRGSKVSWQMIKKARA